MTYLMGIDIGYGFSKFVDNRGGQAMELSAYCPVPAGLQGEAMLSAQRSYPSLTLHEAETDYLLGSMAAAHTPSTDRLVRLSGRNNTQTGYEFRVRMMKMGASRLLAGETDGGIIHTEIVTGLPVNYMGDADRLKEALLGQHVIHTDTTNVVLNVTRVVVPPQPVGTMFDNLLSPAGNPVKYDATETVVFDIGTLTAQIVTHVQNGTGTENGYIAGRSMSVDTGAHIVQEALYEWLEENYHSRDLPLARINRAIETGVLHVQGKDVNVREVRDRACEVIYTNLQTAAASTIGAGLQVDKFLITGGMARLMHNYLAADYGEERTLLAEDSQWANANGFFKLGLMQRNART